jgi:adenylate cyclase
MRSYVKEILISVIYWSLVNIFIVTVRFVGIDFFFEPRSDMPLIEIYSESLPGGLIFGLLWGFIEIIHNRVKSKKRRSFGIVVVSKTLIYTILFMILVFFATWPGRDPSELAKNYVTSAFSIVNFVLFVMAAFLFLFFKQMNKMFGPGILLQYLTGKYFNPKEEDRVFMFLDLKSSTTIAEKLSHVLYSKLIQDCFSELTDPVLDWKGQIYQYVGDGAIITWKKEDGLNNVNCLNFYYDFINRLESKKEFFLRSYKVFPEFKAGLSLGLVMVAEVGELKTEIAYHGDVLNTAARIEAYCSEFNKPLLASEALVQELEKNKQFIIHLIGEVQLRGKEGISRIYSCEKPTANTVL